MINSKRMIYISLIVILIICTLLIVNFGDEYKNIEALYSSIDMTYDSRMEDLIESSFQLDGILTDYYSVYSKDGEVIVMFEFTKEGRVKDYDTEEVQKFKDYVYVNPLLWEYYESDYISIEDFMLDRGL